MASSVLYGLKVMIPWSELNLQLCGESSIAQEALLKVIALRPHLIITDIRIPQKNGLELIDGVRKLDITTEFVILSGYPDFFMPGSYEESCSPSFHSAVLLPCACRTDKLQKSNFNHPDYFVFYMTLA